MARKPLKISDDEIALIKGMIRQAKLNDQEILAYFTRPNRTINHRVISEIRTGHRKPRVMAASDQDLEKFLNSWPPYDLETGLDPKDFELVIKAREAMIAAVHVFNSAGLRFRAELFIVTAMIAWTYALHAYFKKAGVDYRHRNKRGEVVKTKEGADRYWDLSNCLKQDTPLPDGAVRNIRFLLELRHEIEHRATQNIDDAISAKLQAMCLNFNRFLKSSFGSSVGLESRVPLTLQFSRMNSTQGTMLASSSDLPPNIAGMIATFENSLNADETNDPDYVHRVAVLPFTLPTAKLVDSTIVPLNTTPEQARELNLAILGQIDRKRFPPGQVVQAVRDRGFPRFTMHHHTLLWKEYDAKNPENGFGTTGDYGQWVYFENWIEKVLSHCSAIPGPYSN